MTETDELHPDLEELLEEVEEKTGMPADVVVQQIGRLGFDLADVSDADQKRFAEAYSNDDLDTIREVMDDNDVPEKQQDKLIDALSGDSEDEPSKNGDSPDSGGSSSGGLTDSQKREVQEIVSQSVPSSDAIASELENRLGGGGGGQQQQGGGGNPQQQMMLELIADHLKSDSGGGASAEIGQQFQKAAMNNYLKKLSRPSMGEIMEMKMYEKIADQEADKYAEEFFGDPMEELGNLEEPDGEDDAAGGWGGFFG